jgi:hypothetical protein
LLAGRLRLAAGVELEHLLPEFQHLSLKDDTLKALGDARARHALKSSATTEELFEDLGI